MVTFGAVKEREFTLIEPGEYCLTLNDLDDSTGQYGDRLIWKFLVAPTGDPTNYICKGREGSGDEKDIWAFTDPDIILGSLQHEFVEKLTGRPFVKGSEPPDENELLGRRVLAYITHYTPKQGKNAGKKQEQIVAGSIKAFRGPQPNKVIAPNVVHQAETVAEDAEDAANRAKLIEEAGRQIAKAGKLETPSASAWQSIDLAELADDALHMVIRDAKDEVQAALDS